MALVGGPTIAISSPRITAAGLLRLSSCFPAEWSPTRGKRVGKDVDTAPA